MFERTPSEFEQLNKEEQEFLYKIPVYITFLVAGSDNEIDSKERDWAERLVEFRATRNESDLVSYYNEVENVWEANFQELAAKVNDFDDVDARNTHLCEEIAQANAILQKLAKGLGAKLYQSYLSFAKQIAMASGGLLGFGAISAEENKWIDLKMLNNPEEQSVNN
jgi:hypothetical protein